MSSVNGTLVEGIGDEVVYGIGCVIGLLLLLMGLSFSRRRNGGQAIHPDYQENVLTAREHVEQDRQSQNGTFRRYHGGDMQCPICLNHARFAVETNCGHMFCGLCIITYWQHGTWLGAVSCPVCRQQVTVLLCYFNEAVLSEQDIEERNQLIVDINGYNRRYSGEPRSVLDYLYDLPTLLRHAVSEFFSVGGLMAMFRLRLLLCFFAALLYLISPLDILPEAVFGILGLIDDVFVLLLLAVYVSIIYRRYLADRGAEGAQ
ncbi:PREDICTED: E3 ubiquitin-protein ligase RNF170-like isoform X2 [Priapulus caudatus]|uniref:E3 ubiquitin-protein ligase RNF170 n=1 Tax=Priapulus caudatus TaxID=37621 RepID=A0ABM1E4E1_PRICU|nr:PREDICTED: E3 ubiquitin-protein ligase RNF170-like isoform X2 [Priapulus caudatus]